MKLRTKIRHFIDHKEGRTILSGKYTVEALQNRRWLPVGDDDGIKKFDSEESADAFMVQLQKDLEKSEAEQAVPA